MAKSSRASSRKANNQRLKRNVFGPIEAARMERLSAKLTELASQPKEQVLGQDSKMEEVSEVAAENNPDTQVEPESEGVDSTKMDVDSGLKTSKKVGLSRRRIEKRRSKKSSIVFPSRKDRMSAKKRK